MSGWRAVPKGSSVVQHSLHAQQFRRNGSSHSYFHTEHDALSSHDARPQVRIWVENWKDVSTVLLCEALVWFVLYFPVL
jgi:hypothetical protein